MWMYVCHVFITCLLCAQKLTNMRIMKENMRTGNLPANMKKNRVLQIIPCKEEANECESMICNRGDCAPVQYRVCQFSISLISVATVYHSDLQIILCMYPHLALKPEILSSPQHSNLFHVLFWSEVGRGEHLILCEAVVWMVLSGFLLCFFPRWLQQSYSLHEKRAGVHRLHQCIFYRCMCFTFD